MEGVLNEHTRTVHKHESGSSELHTVCGVSYNLAAEKLLAVPVSRATTADDAEKCGRCFDDAGGY
ncbi:MAG: hypothetical protein V5A44_07715 [Haloarculaceae archaeon]